MRITLTAKVAACLATALAVTPLALAVAPSSAATPDPVSVAAQPAEGSTNVKVDGNRIILGDAPASMGSVEVRERSGIANLDPIRFPAATSAVIANYQTGTPDGSTAEVDVRALVKDQWTEWTPARNGSPTALPEASDLVQLRIIVIAPPQGGSP